MTSRALCLQSARSSVRRASGNTRVSSLGRSLTAMSRKTTDLSLSVLREILVATEALLGPDAGSVRILRRAIAIKRRESERARKGAADG